MISIVIPTYNEKDNIKPLLERIHGALPGIPHEVVFVDDSQDSTPEVIAEIAKTDPTVVLHHRSDEKGLATAVVKGFSLAKGDYVAVMDADLQHPPEVLMDMYAAMEAHADMAIPSRFIPGGSDGGLNLWRKFVSWTARYIGKILLPCLRKVTDPTSGLFMIRRELLEGIALNPIGWKIMVEVIAMCPVKKVLETPYVFQEREAGESKLSTKVTIQYLKQVFHLMSAATNRGKGMKVQHWSLEKLEEKKLKYGSPKA
ncbi:MAG: polyprenol monophosphomannose synthase [Lachnospiraceae bacterium]|nr:polyprenol monophosphomannose synthase [Lachnospiraceae bacterium]MBQ8261875.1 polyprenol monophosphomannose synthase [Lachnospiraceae bacterium]